MSRFLSNAKRSLDSLLNLITDQAGDVLLFFRLPFRSRTALSAEVLFLRKQLAFYEERQVQPRRLNDSARFSLILWSRLCTLVIVKPETLIGWHRKGFQLFWKWKSQAGRPRIPENIRKLIVQMAQENPTWGQARVAAELSVKLGTYVSPRTVRAYWPPEPERRERRRTSSVAQFSAVSITNTGGKGSPRERRKEFRRRCTLLASPQFLLAVRVGLPVPFVCHETPELGKEFVGSYRYQVHLQHWLDSNHDHSLSDNVMQSTEDPSST